MSKLIPLVTDDKEFWTAPPPKFGSIYGPAKGFNISLDYIMIQPKRDNPKEAARLYKENHNPARANKEWTWLDRFCSKVYTNYCKLWGECK